MKNLIAMCLAIGLLSLGVHAQENVTEATLMILDKESNLPICQFSDQVRINSDFIPHNRIGSVDSISIEDVRVCEEDDVWDAVEEEMTIGMAVAPTAIGAEIGLAHIAMSTMVPAVALIAGIVCNDAFADGNVEWTITLLRINGIAAIRGAYALITKSGGKFVFFNPMIGTLVTGVGLAACVSGLGLVEFDF